ncbi:hypothetical protein THAOC_28063 [Thalassiosira oceanica]|uniref:Transmembrane protein 242 n=1 Tax=Thalassiosira oceanica TaxID=159749 RepID=K0RFZ8_THAOC|nr:hypothetical protein THAOC_28063 [Thalassiosira oceanica]|eukprot:EJK52638.1 hypothetical protein THAOC_28063 [Thalassiosira oceanica]
MATDKPDRESPPPISPGAALLACSLPLSVGTYLGYRRALSSPHSGSSLALPSSQRPPLGRGVPATTIGGTPPAIVAARALALGSLLSVSATGLLVSGVFYLSGCRSVDDLVRKWREWAPRKLREVEMSVGLAMGLPLGESRRAATEEYAEATRGMNEEQEIAYVARRYADEFKWDDDGSQEQAPGSGRE